MLTYVIDKVWLTGPYLFCMAPHSLALLQSLESFLVIFIDAIVLILQINWEHYILKPNYRITSWGNKQYDHFLFFLFYLNAKIRQKSVNSYRPVFILPQHRTQHTTIPSFACNFPLSLDPGHEARSVAQVSNSLDWWTAKCCSVLEASGVLPSVVPVNYCQKLFFMASSNEFFLLNTNKKYSEDFCPDRPFGLV